MTIQEVFDKYLPIYNCLSQWTSFITLPDADTIVIVLPGGGSTCMTPSLYYTSNLAVERGHDIIWFEYEARFVKDPDRRSSLKNDVATFIYQLYVDGALDKYQRIVMVGKSIGTRAMGRFFHKYADPSNDLGLFKKMRSAKLMMLTPDFRDPDIVAALALMPSSLLIWAGEDMSDPDDITEPELLELHRVIGLKGADHGFDIEDDIAGSIQLISKIVDVYRRYLDD